MSLENSSKSPISNIVDLSQFRQKKNQKEDLARGRTPLYMSHLDGKVSGSPHQNTEQKTDMGDRLSRIKASLERINKLMVELKNQSKKTLHEPRD